MWPFPDSGQNVNVKVESSQICILLVSSLLSCRVITFEFALHNLNRGPTLVRYKAGAIYFGALCVLCYEANRTYTKCLYEF